MAGVAGIGSFMYFMGRSFPTNCMTFLPWVVLICSLLADRNMSVPDGVERSDSKVLTIAKNTACFAVAGIAMCSAFSMTGNVFNADSDFNKLFNNEQNGIADMAVQINKWKDEKCDGKTPYVLLTYAAFVEENMGIPALVHSKDPAFFWHKDQMLPLHVEKGWCYEDGGFESWENLHRETLEMLDKHPGLKVILAHFFFLSDMGL